MISSLAGVIAERFLHSSEKPKDCCMFMAGLAEEVSSSATSSPLLSFMSISPTALGSSYSPWLRDLKSEERGLFLIHLLLNCANHVAAGNIDQSNAFLEHISLLASPEGDTMQRIASYFSEALALRLLRSYPGLYRAINPSSADASFSSAARRLFLDACPFLRLSHLVSNQAILEAMDGEKVVHIVDLGGSDSSQWLGLLQSLAARPEGPPHLRISVVGEDKNLLLSTGSVLSKEAEKLDIPFQFNPVVSNLESLNVESLRVKTGEALAINSTLQLHSLLSSPDRSAISSHSEKDQCSDSSSSPLNFAPSAKLDSFLISIWGLLPKIMVVTEQESNHNGPNLTDRFMESLNFYAAVFDCLESTMPRQSAERAAMERMLFGEEIKNIISCEGSERRERHEKLERWGVRMEIAGFGRSPLSYYGMLQARRMLQGFGGDLGYRVKGENGCFMFCWQDRPLFSVSAWSFRRFD